MLSQTWPTSRETEGQTLRAMEISAKTGLFVSFQTVEIPYSDERRAVARLVESENYTYTYCAARVINENSLDLGSGDPRIASRTIEELVRQVDHAREAGASSLSFVSGPAPDSEVERRECLKRICDTITRLSEHAHSEPEITLVIEPLDVQAHKKMSLGFMGESVQLCKDVAAAGGSLSLCMDTAHMLLNDEVPERELESAHPFTSEYHYSNCVTTPGHSMYGDYHIPFGRPGVVGVPEIARLMERQLDMGFLNPEKRPVVMCEVLQRPGDDPVELTAYCADTMESAWSLAQEGT